MLQFGDTLYLKFGITDVFIWKITELMYCISRIQLEFPWCKIKTLMDTKERSHTKILQQSKQSEARP